MTRRLAVVLLAATSVAVALLAGACGRHETGTPDPDVSLGAPTTSGPAASPMESSTTAPTTAPTTTAPPTTVVPACPIDVVSASRLLDEALSVVADGGEPMTCRFESPHWRVSVDDVRHPLAAPPDGEGLLPRGQPDPAVEAPNRSIISRTRSGDFEGWGYVAVGDAHWMVTLRNRARGSDTDPPAEGPPQLPVTTERLRRILQHLAATSPGGG